MSRIPRIRRVVPAVALSLAAVAGGARAELVPAWVVRESVGSSLSAGLRGMVTDAAGVTYVTGTSGPSSNTDITTAAFDADGSRIWSQTFNGPGDWHDQARGITLAPGGRVWVTGNTPGAARFADVLLLAYDAATGALLDTVQYSSGAGISEHGASVVTNAAGEVFVAGGTVGDGGDALILKFDSDGLLRWTRTWDGPASAPFSQDNAIEILLDPSGNPVVLIHGVMSSLHPDYVLVKYDAGDGSTLWEMNWGLTGGDFPRDLEIDAAGDLYVTGTGFDFTDKLSTIKVRGGDGQLLWQAYDAAGIDDAGLAITLDGEGGVFIAGRADPDGDESNFNDNIFTVKRDAASGGLLWTHLYGANCVGCYDVPGDVAVDPAGNVLVAGSTSSPPYSLDAILLVLDTDSGLETDRGILSGGASEGAATRALRFDAAFNIFAGGEFENFDTGAVDMSLARYDSLTGGPDPVGGMVFEASLEGVICKNETTGQKLPGLIVGEDTWDCTGAGLVVEPGDRVIELAGGTALGSSVGGAVTGVSLLKIICRNETTRTQVQIIPAGDSWNCADWGLAISPGDAVLQLLVGDAD